MTCRVEGGGTPSLENYLKYKAQADGGAKTNSTEIDFKSKPADAEYNPQAELDGAVVQMQKELDEINEKIAGNKRISNDDKMRIVREKHPTLAKIEEHGITVSIVSGGFAGGGCTIACALGAINPLAAVTAGLVTNVCVSGAGILATSLASNKMNNEAKYMTETEAKQALIAKAATLSENISKINKLRKVG